MEEGEIEEGEMKVEETVNHNQRTTSGRQARGPTSASASASATATARANGDGGGGFSGAGMKRGREDDEYKYGRNAYRGGDTYDRGGGRRDLTGDGGDRRRRDGWRDGGGWQQNTWHERDRGWELRHQRDERPPSTGMPERARESDGFVRGDGRENASSREAADAARSGAAPTPGRAAAAAGSPDGEGDHGTDDAEEISEGEDDEEEEEVSEEEAERRLAEERRKRREAILRRHKDGADHAARSTVHRGTVAPGAPAPAANTAFQTSRGVPMSDDSNTAPANADAPPPLHSRAPAVALPPNALDGARDSSIGSGERKAGAPPGGDRKRVV